MANDNKLDEQYLSQETRETIAEVRQELQDNPVSLAETLYSQWKVHVELPLTIHILKTMIRMKHFLSGE